MFRSTERLAPCPEVYDAERVSHAVELDLDYGKPVVIAYHTSHIVSKTGKMVLARGAREGYVNSIVGLLHDREDRFEIEPLVPVREYPIWTDVGSRGSWSARTEPVTDRESVADSLEVTTPETLLVVEVSRYMGSIGR